MLTTLSIRDILLIEQLDLVFQPGLNVLTGETGAGKSILLDSLGFVLGWRGRAEVVRSGASEGEVEAVFDLAPDHPAQAVLEEAGLPFGEDLILRRIASADGRKRAFVNDRRASTEVMRALSDTLVELHGQQDDKGLLNTRRHRQYLDQFAGLDLAPVKIAWNALRTARAALTEGQEAVANAARDRDFLEHAVSELDALAPEAGEDATLDTARRLMKAAAKIKDDVAKAAQAIGPGEGASGRMADAMRWLENAAEKAEGQLDDAVAALSRAYSELGEAERGVDQALSALSTDPLELDRTEERLFAIRGLARKHNVAPDELSEYALTLRARLEAVTAGDSHLAGLSAAVEAARAEYDAAAATVTAARMDAATRLDAAMADELAPLKMERAVFATSVDGAEAGPEGVDDVGFVVATNPGALAGSLSKIASGGELSRFLLALKVCLAGASGRTMIFDEIDRGVGGATADAVGRRLAALADEGQVLVVTHSPQVAALGAHHWQVAKGVIDGATRTDVVPLGHDARVAEIARMLSGEVITDAARSAAEALLDG